MDFNNQDIINPGANVWTFKDLQVVKDKQYNQLKENKLNRWGNVSFLIRKLQKLLSSLKKIYKN